MEIKMNKMCEFGGFRKGQQIFCRQGNGTILGTIIGFRGTFHRMKVVVQHTTADCENRYVCRLLKNITPIS